MAKTKTKVTPIVTEMEANEVLARYAKADSALTKLNAELDLKITKLREEKAEKIAEYTQELKDTNEILLAFAAGNPQLFESKKTLDMQHGSIGYRTSPPAVNIKKGVKVETVVELLQNSKIGQQYVKTKTTYSLDKEAILAKREDTKLMGKLGEYFITVEQAEVFFVDPKTEA